MFRSWGAWGVEVGRAREPQAWAEPSSGPDPRAAERGGGGAPSYVTRGARGRERRVEPRARVSPRNPDRDAEAPGLRTHRYPQPRAAGPAGRRSVLPPTRRRGGGARPRSRRPSRRTSRAESGSDVSERVSREPRVGARPRRGPLRPSPGTGAWAGPDGPQAPTALLTLGEACPSRLLACPPARCAPPSSSRSRAPFFKGPPDRRERAPGPAVHPARAGLSWGTARRAG